MYLTSGGDPDYAVEISDDVRSRVGLELANWCPHPLRLRDPSDPLGEASIRMDDAAEVLRWSHTKEYHVWMDHTIDTMKRCLFNDLPHHFAVSGHFLRVVRSHFVVALLTLLWHSFSRTEEALPGQALYIKWMHDKQIP